MQEINPNPTIFFELTYRFLLLTEHNITTEKLRCVSVSYPNGCKSCILAKSSLCTRYAGVFAFLVYCLGDCW